MPKAGGMITRKKRNRDAPSNDGIPTDKSGHDDDGYFGSIGLPETVGWYVSAALYWIGGITVLVIERVDGATIEPLVGILATITLAVVPLLVLGARYMPLVWWGPYVRITLPLFILGIGAIALKDNIGSLVLITLFPVLAVAYLHEAKISLAYCALGISTMLGALILFDTGPGKWARVVVLGGSLTAVTYGLIFAQQRLRAAAAENRRLSLTDPLTGLANLRRLKERLVYEIQRSSRTGDQIVIYAIDLDDFKLVNDDYSYELGDRVLRSVAKSLTNEMGPGDLLVRRGGDEFAVLTLITPDRDPVEFGRHIGQTISRARLAVCPEVNPRASVSCIEHQLGEPAAEFLERVDEGLHEAKLDAHPERRETEAVARTSASSQPVIDEVANIEEPLSTRPAKPIARIGSHSRKADNHAAWSFVGAACIVQPALLGVVAWTGLAPDLNGQIFLACLGGSVLCAAFSVLGRNRGLRLRMIHLPLGLSMLLMTIAISQAGESRVALLELYAIQPPIAIYVLGRKDAIPYVAATGYFYSFFLISSGYPNAPIRILIFVGAISVLCLMLVRGQREVREFSRKAAELSVVDPLTGVGNLRSLRRRVEDEVGRCALTGDGLALMVVDLDGFKFVNDRFSHTLGDAVLVESANAIRSTVRDDELVARRGGDEFAIVCSPDEHADVGVLAERVADAISQARARLTSGIPTGATVRYILWDGEETADDFMRRADIELHDAKALRDESATDAPHAIGA